MGKTESGRWDDHWSEVRSKTETQRVRRTDTQRIARVDSRNAREQRRDAHDAGLKAGYGHCLSDVIAYLRHANHYQQKVDLQLIEDWRRNVEKWRKTPNSGPPPQLIWERLGKFGG